MWLMDILYVVIFSCVARRAYTLLSCKEVKQTMPATVVFIDGPPGAGKTTVMQQLSRHHKAVIITEPVTKWAAALNQLQAISGTIADADPNDDHTRSMYVMYELNLIQLQTMILAWYQQIAEQLPLMINNPSYRRKLIVIERSPFSAKIFHALACRNEMRSIECQNQLQIIATQLPEIAGDFYIDLRITAELAGTRLAGRKAPGDELWKAEDIAAYYELYDALVAEHSINPTRIDILETDTPKDSADKIINLVRPPRPRIPVAPLFD